MKFAFDIKIRSRISAQEFKKKSGVNPLICERCADEVVHVSPRLQTAYFRHKTANENAVECELRTEGKFKEQTYVAGLGNLRPRELLSLISAIDLHCMYFMERENFFIFPHYDEENIPSSGDFTYDGWLGLTTRIISENMKINQDFSDDLVFVFLSRLVVEQHKLFDEREQTEDTIFKFLINRCRLIATSQIMNFSRQKGEKKRGAKRDYFPWSADSKPIALPNYVKLNDKQRKWGHLIKINKSSIKRHFPKFIFLSETDLFDFNAISFNNFFRCLIVNNLITVLKNFPIGEFVNFCDEQQFRTTKSEGTGLVYLFRIIDPVVILQKKPVKSGYICKVGRTSQTAQDRMRSLSAGLVGEQHEILKVFRVKNMKKAENHIIEKFGLRCDGPYNGREYFDITPVEAIELFDNEIKSFL